MFTSSHFVLLRLCAVALAGLLMTPSAQAECGGNINCISISDNTLTLGTFPVHLGPNPTYDYDFGGHELDTLDDKAIQVRAVTGPPGGQATISAIVISGAQSGDFAIDLGNCEVGIPSLTHNESSCTFTVSFSPTAVGTRNAVLKVTSPRITRTVNLSGTGVLPPPSITSALTATGQPGVALTPYRISATYSPTSFNASPLPDGLSVDTATGEIAGTPTTAGTVDTTISATNAAGTASATLRFTISESAPVITSADSVSAGADVAFPGYTITATNNPTRFGASGLPPGLSVDTASGRISGVATAAGAFAVTVTATNSTATASKAVTFTISAVPPAGANAAVSVPLNTATVIDLATLTSGTGVDSARIIANPSHGRLTLAGLKATYTPTRDYFGPDSFSYVAIGAEAESSPASVTIEVVGRPDPTADADTRALVRSQTETAKRVSRAQIANVQRRLETLHRRHGARAVGTGPLAAATAAPALAAGDATFDDDPGGGLLGRLAEVAQSGSLTLDNDYLSAGDALPAGLGVWVGGSVGFGTRDATGGDSKLRFTTDGISAGVDKVFSDALVLGLAMGYAKDQTEVGVDDSDNDTEFWSISAYGSYQPLPQLFIDGMLGYGHLDYAARRYVSAFDTSARSDRDGDQLFGSLALAYEYRRDRLLISPYGRVDFAFTWLDSSTETGAGQASLHYFSQDFDSGRMALGVRAESAHEMAYGWVIPRLRLEYLHQFESTRRQRIAYADQTAGQRYWLLSPDSNENALLVSVGSDFELNGGLRLGFDYQTIQAAGPDDMQAFGLWLSKAFDEVANPWSLFAPRPFRNPVRVEASFMWDENLNRTPLDGEKLDDKLYGINVSQRFVHSISSHVRLVSVAALGGTKLHRHDGLDNVHGELRGELQYRTSGSFFAPTLAVYARLRGEEFSSKLRSGYRYSYGVNARQALSDRIGAFAAVERNVREGDSEVFENRDWATRIHLDYALGSRGFLYVGGEFRHGDMVTSIDAEAAYEGGVAEVAEPDDAYYNRALVAARVDAETWMASAGYNLPLGARDSLDFSWRWVLSTPDRYGAADDHGDRYAGGGSYVTNQLSVAYLLKF